MVDQVVAAASHGGAERGVELLLLVVLQVEGLQRVHGPVEQRVVEQHLDSTATHTHTHRQLTAG